MSASETVIMVALTLALGFAGWNCVIKNDYVVKIHRQQFGSGGGARFYPFSKLIAKPWYPAFLRGCGITIWLCTTLIIYLTWFREPAH